MKPLMIEGLDAVLAPVASDLQRIEEVLKRASAGPTEFLTETASYLADAGGKRVRPAVTALAARMGDGPNGSVYKSAAAIEMTHLATLYHDDVIDEADLRRGVMSVNEKWDNHVAILAGDHLFARASGLVAEVGGEIPLILADAVARVVAGQLQEVRGTYDLDRTEEHYMSTIAGKTAALLEASARIGALCGSVGDDTVGSMSVFGRSFGFAFQIADDLLDLAATREQLGKPPGTDLLEGVYTLPVIYAMKEDSAISSLLGTPEVDIDKVKEAVFSTSGFEMALGRAREQHEIACLALDSLKEGEAKAALLRLSETVITRVPEPV